MTRKVFTAIAALLLAGLLCACAGTAAAAFSEDDLSLKLDGSTFSLGEDPAGLLAALGEPTDLSEAISCVYTGTDRIYSYDGLQVYTVPAGDDGADVIEMIAITGEDFEAAKGLKVGDSLEKAESLYGTEYFDDGYITYTETNDPQDIQSPRLQLMLDGDVIREIYLYAPRY